MCGGWEIHITYEHPHHDTWRQPNHRVDSFCPFSCNEVFLRERGSTNVQVPTLQHLNSRWITILRWPDSGDSLGAMQCASKSRIWGDDNGKEQPFRQDTGCRVRAHNFPPFELRDETPNNSPHRFPVAVHKLRNNLSWISLLGKLQCFRTLRSIQFGLLLNTKSLIVKKV